MSRLGIIAILICALAGAAAITHAAMSSTVARRDADLVLSALNAARGAQAELSAISVRATAGVVAISTESADATPLAQRVSDALASAGLPVNVMQSLSPDAAPTSGPVQRRRATLTLGQLTLPQFGRFLAAWRERSPHWAVTSVSLTPDESAKATASVTPGSDRHIHAVLVLESIAIVEETP